ncbi:hypothetical protein Selin_0813 [Desulfurispirillum indicum S5]|uniref:Uncharacterized protein n=1 Tax=Desulfurispirillum indicum (strain ATCC BAA-1389 / DSM 22839 / S5) TaxID=653733 RepID=E6W295_DESIS|nr:hypothetical protein Selin_0813 [Desulfurispirillum indicum S5]
MVSGTEEGVALCLKGSQGSGAGGSAAISFVQINGSICRIMNVNVATEEKCLDKISLKYTY